MDKNKYEPELGNIPNTEHTSTQKLDPERSTLIHLPGSLMYHVLKHLTLRDLSAFCRTDHLLYSSWIQHLYIRDLKNNGGVAMGWGITNARLSTVRQAWKALYQRLGNWCRVGVSCMLFIRMLQYWAPRPRVRLWDEEEEVLEWLLRRGVPVSVRKSNGLNLLRAAVYCEGDSLVHILLDHGADVKALNESPGTRLLSGLAALDAETVAELIEKGLKADLTNSIGDTLLHKAAEHGNDELCRLLVKHGAKVDAVNIQKRTPLYAAVFFLLDYEACYIPQDIMKRTFVTLITLGADINVTDYPEERTLLDRALECSDILVVMMLINLGARRRDSLG